MGLVTVTVGLEELGCDEDGVLDEGRGVFELDVGRDEEGLEEVGRVVDGELDDGRAVFVLGDEEDGLQEEGCDVDGAFDDGCFEIFELDDGQFEDGLEEVGVEVDGAFDGVEADDGFGEGTLVVPVDEIGEGVLLMLPVK